MTPDVPAICAGLGERQREVILKLRHGPRRAIDFSGSAAHALCSNTGKRPPLLTREIKRNNGLKVARYMLNEVGIQCAHLLREQGDRIDGEGGRDGNGHGA